MTGSPIKSTVPSDSVEEVRVMAAPSVAMPLFKEGARPPLAPAKTQREAGLSKAQSGAGNGKISTPPIPGMTQTGRKWAAGKGGLRKQGQRDNI